MRSILTYVLLTLPLWTLVGCTAGGGGDGSMDTGVNDPLMATSNTLNTALAPAIVNDARFDAYLREIDQRLSTAAAARGNAGVSPAVHLVRTSGRIINVATLGAGHIYLTSEALQQCTSEEDLAACVAEGFAHVALRQRRSLQAPAGTVQGADSPPLTPEQIAIAASQNPFTPNEIADADRTAYELFARGGWDPDRFGNIFQRLADSGQTPAMAVSTLRRRASMRPALPSGARDWRMRNLKDETAFHDLQVGAISAATRRGVDAHADQMLSALPNVLFGVDQPEQKQAADDLVSQSQQQTQHLNKNWNTRGRPNVVPD